MLKLVGSNRPRFLSGNNKFRTASLFYEMWIFRTPEQKERVDPVFTLKDYDYTAKDGKHYPSLKRIYLSYNDPTEYQFAMDVFESWQNWEELRDAAFFKEYYPQWRRELELRLSSIGMDRVIKEIQNDGANSFKAAQWLATEQWKKSSSKAGRPVKDRTREKELVEAKNSEDIYLHASRLLDD